MTGETGKIVAGIAITVAVLALFGVIDLSKLFGSSTPPPIDCSCAVNTCAGQTCNNGQCAGTKAGCGTIPDTKQCAYAPTVSLGANDKYTGGQTNWGTWKYKLNGGTTTTDSDGNFEVKANDILKVLVADANSSAYYRHLWEIPRFECGINSLADNGVIQFTTYATICYNEIGDPINATTYGNNLTVGSGGSRSVKCDLTGVNKKGMPYGGVMVLEFNQTTWKEEDFAVTFDGVSLAQVNTPPAYSVGIAGATTKSYTVPALEGPATHTFYVNVIADSNQDPGGEGGATTTAYGNSIVLRIYPVNYYEEEDVTPSEFKLGVYDIDNTFMSPGGTAKANAAITTVIIPVA